jgi:protein TonB
VIVLPASGWRPASPAASSCRRPVELVFAAGVVAAIHVAATYALWTHRLVAAHAETRTLQVDIVAPAVTPPRAPPPNAEPRRPPPANKREMPRQKPAPRQPLLATPPRPTGATAAAAVAEQQPVVEAPAVAPPPALPAQRAPAALGSELSVVCHHRPAPAYPPLSRRLEETGEVLLRVELNEDGSVAAARIERSSGHQRLDDAALTAVRAWRCSVPPAFGRSVRAVALQPFRFVLQ